MKKMNISHNSKHFLNVLLLILMLVGINTNVWAAWSGSGQGVNHGGVWYVLYEDGETSINNWSSADPKTLSGPGAKLSFTAKRQAAATGDLKVTDNFGNQYYKGNPGHKTSSFMGIETATDYDNYGTYDVNLSATSLTFENTGTLHQYVKNIKVTMAQYIENPTGGNLVAKDGFDGALTFGEGLNVTSSTVSRTFTIAWCNVPALTTSLSGGASTQYSVVIANNSAAGKYNTATVTVTYNHTAAGTHNETLTISGTGYSKRISLSGSAVAIESPVYEWRGANTYYVDDVLDLQDMTNIWHTTSDAARTFTIETCSKATGINNNDSIQPYIESNRYLHLGKACTIKIKLAQPENAGYYAGSDEKILTVNKRTPVFTWNAGGATYYYGSTIPGIFSTSNTDFGYTIVSNNEAAANVIGNTLYIYNVEETAEITVTQEENYKWNDKTATYVVTPVELNNHVEFNITSENINIFKYGTSSNASLDGNGYKLGDGGLDKTVCEYSIQFTGIPEYLSFDKHMDNYLGQLPVGSESVVYESADGTNWIEVWKNTERKADVNGTNILLKPTTRYLKFYYNGSIYCYYKNIHVTELNQFSATPALVDFGTKGVNFGTQEKEVIFSHANAGRITTMKIVGDDAAYFSIERSSIPGTGRDLYGTVTINVDFDNKKGPAGHEPEYSAVLRIEDNAGHFLNIPLSGVRDGKTEPEFSFNANHLPYFVGTNIANVASSSNTDYANCPLTFETSDASIAQVIDGTLHIYNKKESVTITIRQGENKDFSAGVAYFTFTPRERPERTVPMQLVKSIYNEGTVEAGSKCTWLDDDGGCIRVGNNNVVVDDWIWYHSEKNFTIAFDGTPGRLSFEYKNTAWLVTPDADHYTYEVQESSDGGTWHTIWYTDATTTEWTAVKEVTLNPSTRYLRFSFSGNYWGFYRNINISELVGYKYLRAESDGRYLSRGALWGTQAIVDDFGMACRISNYTNDNTNFYTRFLFVDNQQYLYEADNHEMFTDDGTAANTYNLWKQNVVDGTIITFQSGNAYPGDSRKDQYITLDGDALALTADAAAATRWQMEDYTEHKAYIDAMMDREAAAAAAKDFGSSVNTLEKVRTEIAENDFEMTHIDIPTLVLGEQEGEYRSGVDGTNAVYDNTISGLEPGFYRLTVKAFYRISSADIAWTCHAAGMESVLAYIYANNVEYPLQSLYKSYHVSPLEPSDELRGGHYYSTDLASADKAFGDEKRYLNDVYVYVEADAGKTTGTLRYGIKNPSYVPGAWLAYEDITLTRIARKEYIFEGSVESDKENWEEGRNWNRESVPNEHHAVIIRSDVVIEDEVMAYSLAIENDAKVTVAPNGGLTVGAGGVRGASAEKLILKAGTAEDGALKGQTGYLRISPYSTQPMPEATVELFSIGYYDYNDKASNIAKWQYVGSPLANDETLAKTVYTKSWVYGWNENSDEWTNQRSSFKLRPFVGFATTQRTSEDGMLVRYAGELVSSQTKENIALAYSGEGRGHNVLANSFSAPIDITKFEDSDFKNADSVIYIFNTGSRKEADSLIAKKSYDVNAPGQYLAIPIGSARLLKGSFGMPTVIASMQGFCVHAHKADAQITLDYSKLVWNGDYAENPNAPARVSAHREEEETQIGNLQISLYTDGGIDYLFLLESDQFDALYESGFDARKLMGDELNVFSVANEEHLAVDATNSIIGTRVGVRTGDETAYTFVFGKVRSENELALLDFETNQTIDINEGTEYTFFAEPNSMIEDRFQIVERENVPAITTDIENVEKESKAHKFIKGDRLFILKNGVLYNAVGAVVR